MRSLLALLLFPLLLADADAGAQALPKALARAARAAGVDTAQLGIAVLPVDGTGTRLSFNARRAMHPASAMKLVTTAAALHLLGPAHVWRTQALAEGSLHDGTLQGNLVLKGGGDPKLTLEEFWLLLGQLRARGVRHIEGDVLVDRALFAPATGTPADFDGDGLRPYNALPDAMLVNFNAVRLHFLPKPELDRVDILMSPTLEALHIDNRLRLTPGECGAWPEDPVPADTTDTLRFEGDFPAACGETTRNFSPLPAGAYVDALFRALWRDLGGTFSGQVRAGVAGDTATTLYTQPSEPLSEVIRDINKFSNNVMARQLYLTLSGTQAPPPYDEAHAFQAVRSWLAAASLDYPELNMENGSGLSRNERIAAASLASLLRHMARSPFAPEYIASLPLSGVDGTMRLRLGETAVAGRAHIKTGYLDGVRASAGYVLDARGRLIVLVCLINGPSARDSKPFHDALIEWVYQGGTRGTCCRGAAR